MRARHIVLVGLMGSGKTTVGALVAERLGRPHVDSDAVIEARTGRTVREIWRSDGEPAFRSLEAEALQEALSAPSPSVVAAAGGVVLAEGNRAALKDADATVFWLTADPDVLLERATRGDHRPLLDGDAATTLREMAADRETLYRDVADVVIEVGDRTPDEVVDEIVKRATDG